MGQIVAAMVSCHAPALFLRQPGEDPAQLDATIAAMRQLGRVIDETKPDALIVVGLDHLEAFSLDVLSAFAGVSLPLLERFSSAGSTPILFDTAGNRLAIPQIRLKPEIVAPDGANTTFFGRDVEPDGFPNFFGTSAAAPHVAAVVALMLQAVPTMAPDRVYEILETTAIDMGPAGFDFDSGFGLIQADRALASIVSVTPEVIVDIRPRGEANRINPNSDKEIRVAILTGNGFDAATVDPNTVRFGATGAEAVPVNSALRDVNGDGATDMVLRFEIQDTGIKCGDTSASLTGQTSSGLSFRGSDSIRTVRCDGT